MDPRSSVSTARCDPDSERRWTVRLLVGVVGVLTGLLGLPAPQIHGQQPSRDTVVPLDSMEVAILRSPAARGRVPYAVDVASGDDLGLGASGAFLKDALDAMVGVRVQNRYNFAVGERLAVRGFGARAQFGIRGVKVLVDGIPATMPDGQSSLDHLDLATLGRAEVLRGPGSSLYGNAAGGVLSLHTRRPSQAEFRQEVRLVGGSHGLLDLDAVSSGTVGGTGYVLGLGRLDYDGFRPDPTRDGEVTYGRADRRHINGQLTRDVGSGTARLTLNVLDLDAENPGSIAASDLADPTPARAFSVQQQTGKELSQQQIGASWDGPGPWGRASVALWGIRRDVLNPIPTSVIDLDRLAGGARALLGGDRDADVGLLGWSAGLELEVQSDDRRNFTNEGGETGDLTLDQDERVVATGVFARLALGIAPGVDASAALRYDRVHFRADDQFLASDDPDDSGERTLDAWSPSAGITADVVPGLTLWGNVATSLETPTTTELVNRPDGSGGFNPELDAQRTTGLEAGARGAFEGSGGPRTVGWELTVFRARITDELVPFEVADVEGRTFFRNAGRSLHKGLEADVKAELGSGFSAGATWTHVDARYDEFVVEGEDFSGNRIPGLARDRFEARLTQDRDRWYWTAGLEWSDDVPVDDAGEEAAEAYQLVDLRTGLRAVRIGSLDFSPFAAVSNLFDESYVAAVTVNAFGGRYYEPGPGRTFHVGATVGWSRER